MALNYIWIGFFLISFVFGLVSLLMGDTDIFSRMMLSTFDSSKTAFTTSIGLTGVLALWLGIMKIGEKAGVVNVLARMLSPFFSKLFPDIPKNHPVMGSIFMNIASNMLGLDNAATPTGLKAMAQMQELNTKKDTATNPMIMFLVLNTSGLTLIPTDYSWLSEHERSSTANGRVHPYLVGNNGCDDSRYTPYSSVATCQYLPTNIVLGSCWYHWLCRTGNVGIRTDG